MTRLSDCELVRPVLVNLVEATPEDIAPEALEAIRGHVERCEACATVLAELVLTGYAVRRALASSQLIEPPVDAWPRLRSRVARRSPRLGFAGSSLTGLAVGAAVALMLVVPFSVPKPSSKVTQEVGLELIVTSGAAAPAPSVPGSGSPSSDRENRADTNWLLANLQARRDATSADIVASPRDQLLRYGELSESQPAVPEGNLPKVQAE